MSPIVLHGNVRVCARAAAQRYGDGCADVLKSRRGGRQESEAFRWDGTEERERGRRKDNSRGVPP